MDTAKQPDEQNIDRKNWLEWAVFSISLVLVLSVLGYLGYQAYTKKPSTPDLYVESWPDPSAHAPYRYRVLLRNSGGTTAEEVLLELALVKGNETLEKAELHIAFAPQESKREGWVIFSSDPKNADTLVARVVSYKKP